MTTVISTRKTRQQLEARIRELEQQIVEKDAELARLAPYANIPTPPLNDAQRAVFDMKPVSWDGEDQASLPPMRLR